MNSNDGILTAATPLTSPEAGTSPPTHISVPAPRTSHTAGKRPRKKRLTAETRACLQRLQALAEPRRLRIARDSEGRPFLEGQYGRIESDDASGATLTVYCDQRRLFDRLRAIPGFRQHQIGDGELRAVFPPDAFDQVARVIKPRRKRGLSSEAARRVGAKTAFRGTSAEKEAPQLRGVDSEHGLGMSGGKKAFRSTP